jgi:hypothetical protein
VTKTPPKSEYFFQQHWESEYFFRKKPYPLPFKLNGRSLILWRFRRLVNTHKHLGVIFSCDCKWTKHINTIIERASKQLNILRKLKFKLNRQYLEIIRCLWVFTVWISVLLKSKVKSFCWLLVLKTIISVLLGFNFTSHLFYHGYY